MSISHKNFKKPALALILSKPSIPLESCSVSQVVIPYLSRLFAARKMTRTTASPNSDQRVSTSLGGTVPSDCAQNDRNAAPVIGPPRRQPQEPLRPLASLPAHRPPPPAS